MRRPGVEPLLTRPVRRCAKWQWTVKLRMHVRRPFVEMGRLQDQCQKLALVTASGLIAPIYGITCLYGSFRSGLRADRGIFLVIR